ncbi:MAG: T9SS type A sorting domain-containing protein, partial [Bacteroidota bacterium]|nr:T9SS type A sorting domain-containing protein [Bacteroidota bacterium]
KTICAGENVTVGTHTYSTSGNYTDVLTAYQNCDSTVTTHLTVLPAITFSHTKTLCAGQSVTVGIHTYTTNGNYTDVLTSYQNCDSTVTTHLTVLPAITFSQTKTLCAGQSLTIGNHTHSSSGTYTDLLISAVNNCDSIITTELIINSVDTSVTVSTLILTASASPAFYQWINCNNGNTPIAGQTNQSFTASANGNYAVVVTQNNCSDTSSCYNIFITGIGENSLASSINIYPNPNTGNFKLEFCFDNIKEESMEIEIFNPLGQSIYQKHAHKTNGCIRETIELAGELAGGVYILKIASGNRLESSRLWLMK